MKKGCLVLCIAGVTLFLAVPWLRDRGYLPGVERLVIQLKSPDPAVRDRAVEALSQKPGSEAGPRLLAALHEPDPIVRQGAAKALGRMAWPRAVQPLAAALRDLDPGVRKSAAEALKRIPIPAKQALPLIEPFAAALRDPEPAVRILATELLGRLRQAKAAEPLIGALADSEPAVRAKAAGALGALGAPGALGALATALADADAAVRAASVAALGQIPVPKDKAAVTADALAAALNDAAVDVRRQAAATLKGLGEPRAIQPLLAALKDGDTVVRSRSAAALGAIEIPKDKLATVVRALATALADADAGVRRSALGALQGLGDPGAFEPIARAVKDADRGIRLAAVEALGKMNVPENRLGAVIEGLGAGLGDSEVQIRLAASTALQAIDDPRVIAPLAAAAKDSDLRVRSGAVEALGRLQVPKDQIGPVVEALAIAIKEGDLSLRLTALDALRNLGDPRAVPTLVAAMERPAAEVRSRAAQGLGSIWSADEAPMAPAVQALTRALRDKDAAVRLAALDALRNIGSSAVIEPITAALQHADAEVRARAARSLGGMWVPQLRAAAVVEALAAALKDSDASVRIAAARALGRLRVPKDRRPAVLEALSAALRDRDVETRRTAADGLGALGDASTVPPLTALLQDAAQPPEVLLAAAEALRMVAERAPGVRLDAQAERRIRELEARDIVELLEQKKVEANAEGAGIEHVSLHIHRLAAEPLAVRIPVGTYFAAGDASLQNMVVTQEALVELQGQDWTDVSVSVACANRPRSIPGIGDRLGIQHHARQKELQSLIRALGRADVEYPVRQAAVWIVTDDADYADLGILVVTYGYNPFGGSRVIDEPEATQAMQICEEAGIDITKKAIWGDRREILAGLKDAGLKRWLTERAKS
jgi:HEAT repeat protein